MGVLFPSDSSLGTQKRGLLTRDIGARTCNRRGKEGYRAEGVIQVWNQSGGIFYRLWKEGDTISLGTGAIGFDQWTRPETESSRQAQTEVEKNQ